MLQLVSSLYPEQFGYHEVVKVVVVHEGYDDGSQREYETLKPANIRYPVQ